MPSSLFPSSDIRPSVLFWVVFLPATAFSLVVEVSPKKAMFRIGDRETVRCAAKDCAQTPSFSWISLVDKPLYADIQNRDSESVITYKSVESHHENTLQCKVACGDQLKQGKVTIEVYGAPGEVQVSGAKEVKVGDALFLRCAAEGKPRPQLQWRVRRPSGQWVELEAGQELVIRNASHSHAGQYQCLASNEVGQRNGSLHVSIQGPPRNTSLTLSPSHAVWEGESVTLSCRTLSVPEGRVRLLRVSEGEEVELRSHEGSEISFSLPDVQLSQAGLYRCEASNRYGSHFNSTQLTVTAFPSVPVIERSGSLLEGENSTFRCVLSDAYPPEAFHIRWLFGEQELPTQTPSETGSALQSSVSLTMKPSLRGRTLTCWAERMMEGVSSGRGRSSAGIIIDVHHPPRNTNLTLSPAHPVREGESVTLSCRTLSVPEGRVRLLRVSEGEEVELRSHEGSEISFSLPDVQLSQAGLYRCEASNRYGSHFNSTQLTVTAPPRNTTVEVFPSQRVTEGDNVTISCHSVSYPPPVATLTKLGNATELYSHNGTFHLTNLTASDAGDYQVNVTNDLGFHAQVFTISVMVFPVERSGEPPRDWEELLIPAVVMGTTLTSAALLLDFVCRSRRKGSYELAKSNPNSA